MTPLHSSPALTRTIADIQTHLDTLRERLPDQPPSQPRSPAHREPYDDPREELEAEIDATQRILSRLREVDTDKNLIDIYHEACGLMSRIIEYPVTIGQNRAGLYLKNAIGSALEALGLDQLPPPGPKAVGKPS